MQCDCQWVKATKACSIALRCSWPLLDCYSRDCSDSPQYHILGCYEYGNQLGICLCNRDDCWLAQAWLKPRHVKYRQCKNGKMMMCIQNHVGLPWSHQSHGSQRQIFLYRSHPQSVSGICRLYRSISRVSRWIWLFLNHRLVGRR